MYVCMYVCMYVFWHLRFVSEWTVGNIFLKIVLPIVLVLAFGLAVLLTVRHRERKERQSAFRISMEEVNNILLIIDAKKIVRIQITLFIDL